MGEIYWPSVFFLLLSALACGFSVAVLLTPNIVRMAFYLVLALGATAGLFFLAGQDFIGAMQLLIYVGGTLVLLVFGVMLTSQERFVSMKTLGGDWVMGLIAGGALLSVLVAGAYSVPEWTATDRAAVEATPVGKTAAPIAMGMVGFRVDQENAPGYLLPFEIVSVHLLVVLVGAAYLARAKRKGASVIPVER